MTLFCFCTLHMITFTVNNWNVSYPSSKTIISSRNCLAFDIKSIILTKDHFFPFCGIALHKGTEAIRFCVNFLLLLKNITSLVMWGHTFFILKLWRSHVLKWCCLQDCTPFEDSEEESAPLLFLPLGLTLYMGPWLSSSKQQALSPVLFPLTWPIYCLWGCTGSL